MLTGLISCNTLHKQKRGVSITSSDFELGVSFSECLKTTIIGYWYSNMGLALLFWFFGDFRCGALLFMVIHVIYKYKNR